MHEKFTERDLAEAVDALAMMRFFPQESRAQVMLLLSRMCPHREALRWLVTEATSRLSDWPGPGELRGLLCTRYDAADGIDRYCTLPGYRAEDYEQQHYERHKQFLAGGYAEESRTLLKQLQGEARRLQ
jgi:hypothetical protein